METRNYGCHYYRKKKSGKLKQNSNEACWAGLCRQRSWDTKTMPKEIFIKKFHHRDIRDIKKLLSILNIITPCEIVRRLDGKKYIKYTLVKYSAKEEDASMYASNILLLNFVRMCWYKPDRCNLDKFFKLLYEYKEGEDPLEFLLGKVSRSIEPAPKQGYAQFGNHSLVYENIILRTVKEFEDTTFTSMQEFIT